jgi:hypothetical protein
VNAQERGDLLEQLWKEIFAVGQPYLEDCDEIGMKDGGWKAKMPKLSQWLSICSKAAKVKASVLQPAPAQAMGYDGDFWHDQYIAFCKELCEACGTPTDTFDPNYVGTVELLKRIKAALPQAAPEPITSVTCPSCGAKMEMQSWITFQNERRRLAQAAPEEER